MSTAVPHFVVVGIGADGWDGLTSVARGALESATVIYGSGRQLAMVGESTARRVPWRSPMSTHLAEVLADGDVQGDTVIHVLASGDPMFHGVGSSVVRAVGIDRVTVIPAPSSAALAAARLGWDLADVTIVSAVTAPVEVLLTALSDRRRLLMLSRDAGTPAALVKLLVDNGFGASTVTVLEQLGGPAERVRGARANAWTVDPAIADVDALNLVAVDAVGLRRSTMPGRSEDEFDHDGQITKSAVRAISVAALEPAGPQVLWDIGAGSGSVSVEWLRADRSGRVVAFERHPDRAERIGVNAARHGVGDRIEVRGAAPDALVGASAPDAVFIGGGLSGGILAAAWSALRPGGRMVVNAVTVENQGLLAQWQGEHRGVLRRIGIENAEPLGGFTVWRPALPIVQWVADKPEAAS